MKILVKWVKGYKNNPNEPKKFSVRVLTGKNEHKSYYELWQDGVIHHVNGKKLYGWVLQTVFMKVCNLIAEEIKTEEQLNLFGG